MAQWVDSGHADYEISIKVTQFTSREWMSSDKDKGVLFDATFAMEATLYDGKNNKIIWRSGTIDYYDRLDEPNPRKSSELVIQEVLRRLTDKLQNTF